MISQWIVMAVKMRHERLHWVDVSSRHSGEEGDGTGEENDRFHDCL